MKKALPKKSHEEPAKKHKVGGATKKKTGTGNKPRYSYPAEALSRKKDGVPSPMQPVEEPSQGDSPTPPPRVPEPLPVDASKFAAQLSFNVKTLVRIAQRFENNDRLEGREGFTHFMGAKLREFNQKQGLDGDYYSRLYDQLLQMAS